MKLKVGTEVAHPYGHVATVRKVHRDGTVTVWVHARAEPGGGYTRRGKYTRALPKCERIDSTMYRCGPFLLVSNYSHPHDRGGMTRGHYSWSTRREWYAIREDDNDGSGDWIRRAERVEVMDTRKLLLVRLVNKGHLAPAS